MNPERPASTSASCVAQLIHSPLGWHVFFLLLIALTFLPRINSEPAGDAATFFLMSSDVAAGICRTFIFGITSRHCFF
jgi:hypothetical protein